MANLGKSGFLAKWSTLFATNGNREINAERVRDFRQDIADSFLNKTDDAYITNAVTASGTDTYTATLSPAITSYATNARYYILFTNANTGAATLNLNGLGAKTIIKNGSSALSAGDIAAGQVIEIVYDGTSMQIIANYAAATSDATESTKGIVELATTSETTTGTDTTRAVTPAGVKAAIDALIAGAPGALDTLNELAAALNDDAAFSATVTATLAAKAPIVSPTFTGTPAAPTAAQGTNTTQVATTAYVQTEAALKMNLGANSSFESLSDASDEYGIAFLSRLGAVFKATAVRWNETLKQLSIDGTQAIWSAIAGVTNGNMGIKALEAVSEAFKIFDNTSNFFSVGVESAKRVVRIFTNFRLYNGVAYNEAEFKSEECAASTTTELKAITMPTDTIMTVDVTNIAVHNVDQDCIFGHAQFTFKNDSGTVTNLSQDKLRYEFQYSTIGTDGYVTSSVSRIDASISSADVSINFVNTVAKHTICQCEIKYNIVTLPVAP